MYMAAMSQNPAALMLMPHIAQQLQQQQQPQQQQYPLYSRVALPTDVSRQFSSFCAEPPRSIVATLCVARMPPT